MTKDKPIANLFSIAEWNGTKYIVALVVNSSKHVVLAISSRRRLLQTLLINDLSGKMKEREVFRAVTIFHSYGFETFLAVYDLLLR